MAEMSTGPSYMVSSARSYVPLPGPAVTSTVVAATPPAPPPAALPAVTSSLVAATPPAPAPVATYLASPVTQPAEATSLARTPSAPVINGSSTYRASTIITTARSVSPIRGSVVQTAGSALIQTSGASVVQTSGSYVAPPILVQSGSYTGAPLPQVMRTIMREPPKSLTEGMLDPAAIVEQKAAYAATVDSQFSQGTTQLIESSQARKQMFIQAAEQQKAQYRIKVQAQLEAQYLAVEQSMHARIFELQECHQQQKAGLEQQAALLTLEYRQKKAEEEMQRKQIDLQRNYHEAHRNLTLQLEKTRDLNMFKPPSIV